MAANNETTIDQDLEDMKNLAIEQQQCFYELLCDCMTYQPDEHKYLKQNIGYALYGPPNNDENTDATESNVRCNTENQNKDADITDTIQYGEKAEAVIKKIYDKICNYTMGTNDDKPIYFAIIYNVVVYSKPKKSKEKENETEKEEDNKGFAAIPIPIFKILRNLEEKTEEKTTGNEKEATEKLIKTNEKYEIWWYIDTSGRIYKNWEDYKTSNNLFECTMVLPKDGLYQADPSSPITEDYSTVWLEIMDSPACSLTSQFCKGADIASTVTGFGALGLSVAALFTPIAPVVVGGAVATGVSAAWAMGRSIQQLVDQSVHEESIHPLDPEAFPQWLTITGSAFGLGAMGGAAAISTAVSRGMTVNTAARVAFNTVQGGNLFLNGVGIIYQGYCMVDRYRTNETVSYWEAVSLATHLMFFGGAVVNIQFAGDIIESSQSKILSDYRETVRTKRLRKQFNRVKRQAAANNSCQMSENAEVIRYIRHRNQLIPNTPNTHIAVNRMADSTKSSMINCTMKNGILIVNGIALLDPIEFAARLIQSGMSTDSNEGSKSSSYSYEDDFRTTQLWSILESLLAQYFATIKKPNCKINTSEFIPLLREMDSLNVDENLLEKMVNIAIRLIQRCRNPEELLFKTMRFIWLYCKTNFKRWGINTCLRMQSNAGFNILRIIITAVFEEIDKLDNLYLAFENYLKAFRFAIN